LTSPAAGRKIAPAGNVADLPTPAAISEPGIRVAGSVNHSGISGMEVGMRTVGRRKERPVGLSASGALLAEGARFNDEMHRLPTGDTTFIPKGVYRFKTHEDAWRHQLECVARGMAKVAWERANGRSG
jgi:hypothetical protein